MKIQLRYTAAALAAAMVFALSGCTAQEKPKPPITLTVWHYYNGAQQQTFSDLVNDFNETVGAQQGIVVEASSKGGLNDLRASLTKSANREIGSDPMPDIFSAYADTAYEFYQRDLLADIAPYISEADRSEYIEAYMNEGVFKEGTLSLFPIAKSTEVLLLNTTDWQPFADATGFTVDDLSTWEGVTVAAQKYYEYTDSLTPEPDDGKAFFGRDSMANYILIGSLQLGTEFFAVKDNVVNVQIDYNAMRRLWNNYYVPFVKGYFTAQGRYRSDDARTGDIISLVASSSSAAYFSKSVTRSDGTSYDIDVKAFPVPNFAGCDKKYAVQQGAGMAVTRSTMEKERAAVTFLKWFTEPEHDLRFTCVAGYLPVRKDANNPVVFGEMIKRAGGDNTDVSQNAITVGMEMNGSYTMYTNGAFTGSYELRQKVESFMSDAAKADREAVRERIAAGESREKALQYYISEERFEEWYTDFVRAMNEN